MAQALAARGEKRYGFAYLGSYSLDFGRISALAVSKRGNLLICDSLKQKIVLVDPVVNYLQHLRVEGNPWDVVINETNDAYVTVPNKKCVLLIDPDRLIIFDEIAQDIQPICISATSDASYLRLSTKAVNKPTLTCFVESRTLRAVTNNTTCYESLSPPCKQKCIATASGTMDYSCNVGSNSILITKIEYNPSRTLNHMLQFRFNSQGNTTLHDIDMLEVPNDICVDDNGHIYVCGQYSHNIVRLTQDGKLVDIPLSCQHGIQYPVAMCFNQDYTKMYIANNWGRSILTFDVV